MLRRQQTMNVAVPAASSSFFCLHRFLIMMVAASSSSSSAFVPTRAVQQSTTLFAVTPIGPFCVFRSRGAEGMDPHMERLATAAPGLARSMSETLKEIGESLRRGEQPDPEKLRTTSKLVEESVEAWETTMTRFRLSKDFQTREYFKLTEACLAQDEETIEGLAAMMKWQAQGMRAIADGQPPPMPPPGVDVEQVMKLQQQQANNDANGKPMPGMQGAPPKITEEPFDQESAFSSPTVLDEFKRLCQDHQSIISFGGSYGDFDPLGKISYIDQVEAVQERWDIFFARFQLMGKLNPKYVAQCNAFLQAMDLTEDEFRELLKQGHDLMRKEAEAERL